MCDGNGSYVVVNNDKGPASACTQIHEQSHIQDWVARYGANSCVGKPAGYRPSTSANGDDYKDFLRDSECRAFEAEKSCVQKCNNPVETKRWQRGFDKNYCGSYDSWKRPRYTYIEFLVGGDKMKSSMARFGFLLAIGGVLVGTPLAGHTAPQRSQITQSKARQIAIEEFKRRSKTDAKKISIRLIEEDSKEWVFVVEDQDVVPGPGTELYVSVNKISAKAESYFGK